MADYNSYITNSAIYLDFIIKINDFVDNWVWGCPIIVLLFGIGVLFTICLRFIQITKEIILKVFKKPDHEGNVSSRQLTLVSSAEVVGIGNITGIATTVATGSSSALFLM